MEPQSEAESEPKKRKTRYQKLSDYCANASQVERASVGIIIIATLLIIILLVAVIHHKALIIHACTNTACIIEAAQIINSIDPTIDPCEDFHRFSCGRVKDRPGNQDGWFAASEKQQQDEFFDLYMQDVQNTDSNEEKVVKSFFRKCMNETQIERDGLEPMKQIVKLAGGWPVVEGSNWEGDFDWLDASYTLRNKGYYYSVYLELKVVPDPDNTTVNIFQVSLPHLQCCQRLRLQDREVMEKIAKIFGANKTIASKEIDATREFGAKLKKIQDTLLRSGTPLIRSSIRDFEHKFGFYDWLEFIIRIAGPNVTVSPDDVVLFAHPDKLKDWFRLLSGTPQRTIANYFMWTVVAETTNYLPKELRQAILRPGTDEVPRKELCLRDVDLEYSGSDLVNPIYVKHFRKYLPEAKRRQIEEIAANITAELAEALKGANWMDEKDQENAIEIAKQMKVVVGLPKTYPDLRQKTPPDTQPTNSTTLDLLAALNKQSHDHLYQLANKPRSEDVALFKEYRQMETQYLAENNILHIPIKPTQLMVFDEHLPMYVSYANVGVLVGLQLSNVLGNFNKTKQFSWSEETREAAEKKIDCLDGHFNHTGFLDRYALQLSSSFQMAHSAYHKWSKINRRTEQGIIGVHYSADQLFWLSTMLSCCKLDDDLILKDGKLYPDMFRNTIRNIPKFAQDFHCGEKSYMNPSKRCELF